MRSSLHDGAASARRRARLLAILFAVYAAIAIPGIALLMPPFQAADELAHAERADQLGAGGLLAQRSVDGDSAGGMAHAGLARLAKPFDPLSAHPTVRIGPAMRAAGAAATGWGEVAWLPFPNTALYPPVFYAPAAAGLTLARIAHAPVREVMLLARLLDGAAGAALAAAAILLAEGAAPILFALFTLPMSMALFAAITQDGPMIVSAALAAVLLSRCWRRSGPFGLGCLLLALVAMARPAYLPLCGLPLLSPGMRWRSRIAGAFASAGATIAWVVLCGRLILPRPAAAQVAAQLAAIRAHPAILDLLLHTTLRKQWVEGFTVGREFIGVLGWLDTTLPNPYYALAGIVLLVALAMSRSPSPVQHAARTASALAILAATVVAVYATQYLNWSRIGGAFVDGVQGRYFLPVAPFLILAIPPRRRLPPRLLLVGLCVFPLLSVAVTLRAILQRYYLG